MNNKSPELVKEKVGRWSLDVQNGWETGLLGKERPNGRSCFDRRPPEHLWEPKNAARLADWLAGKESAEEYRKTAISRYCHFVGYKADGTEVVVRRKGTPTRGPILSMMEHKLGVRGDVKVFFFKGTEIVRTLSCGI